MSPTPSPGLGWRGNERRPLADRGAPDLLLCLALVHHVVIGRNVPLADFVAWLASFEAEVVLEFVDRGDPMVERLLRNRREQSIDYSREALEAALANRFRVVARTALAFWNADRLPLPADSPWGTVTGPRGLRTFAWGPAWRTSRGWLEFLHLGGPLDDRRGPAALRPAGPQPRVLRRPRHAPRRTARPGDPALPGRPGVLACRRSGVGRLSGPRSHALAIGVAVGALAALFLLAAVKQAARLEP